MAPPSRAPEPAGKLNCPSAQPEWKGSVVLGVVQGTPEQPRLVQLGRTLPVTDELLKMAEPVTPTEVFRFAAPCVKGACQHFRSGTCRLAVKIVRHLEPVTDELPACEIRDRCRWFAQEGAEACFRCPAVVTDQLTADPVLRFVTDPGA